MALFDAPPLRPQPRVVALVLAAGASTRFGSDKRQARLPDGRSLLEAVVQTHRQVLDEVWVLTRPGDAFAQGVCQALGARCVVCADAVLGQGHTLADGLRQLADGSPEVAGALVSLADMPWVRADTLQRLCERFAATGRVVLPRFGEALGQPRLLPRAVWPRLLGQEAAQGRPGLHGDKGAQGLLDWAAAEQVPVDDPGVLRDADTPEALLGPR